MAEPLKTFFSRALVTRLASQVAGVHPSFPVRAFVRDACRGLEHLELLDRGRHLARMLSKHLPQEYPEALAVLLRTLGPEHTTDELIGIGMAPFFYLPHSMFIAEGGLEQFDLSMHAQYELTKRFSAEFCIRPYLAHDPERAWTFLEAWATDTNAHVRRLVSEGTRMRLPWGMRVAWLDANPERVLSLLEQLKDDDSEMVRRSVANNLNDLGKLHPALLIRTARAWLEGASAERRALVEHALRHAVKRGEKEALQLLGVGRAPRVSIDTVTFTPRRVRIGQRVAMTFTLASTAAEAQDLLVSIAVHFIKATKKSQPKVFKVARVTLGPRERVEFRTSVSLAIHTTRVPRPGRHHVDVIVNGVSSPAGWFQVVRAEDRQSVASGSPAAVSRRSSKRL